MSLSSKSAEKQHRSLWIYLNIKKNYSSFLFSLFDRWSWISVHVSSRGKNTGSGSRAKSFFFWTIPRKRWEESFIPPWLQHILQHPGNTSHLCCWPLVLMLPQPLPWSIFGSAGRRADSSVCTKEFSFGKSGLSEWQRVSAGTQYRHCPINSNIAHMPNVCGCLPVVGRDWGTGNRPQQCWVRMSSQMSDGFLCDHVWKQTWEICRDPYEISYLWTISKENISWGLKTESFN